MFKGFGKTPAMNFSTVILFSKLDAPFIDACIAGVLNASNKVVLVAYDRLLDGQEQNDFLAEVMRRNAGKNIELKVIPLAHEMVRIFPVNPKLIANTRIFLNIIRKVGFDLIKDTAEYTLFIDGDEIAEPQKLLRWKNEYRTKANSLMLANYYYFREPVYRADRLEYSPVLVRNSNLEALYRKDPLRFLNMQYERRDYLIKPCEKIEEVFFHHYSWARTKEEMLTKVKNWGHRKQRNWQELVENEFSHEFNGKDFIHGYNYSRVPNLFDIKL